MPPASVSPMMDSSCTVIGRKEDAQHDRGGDAPEDHLGADFRRTRDAAMPTTMALSPASTRSIIMMFISARKFSRYQSMLNRMPGFLAEKAHARGQFLQQPVHANRPSSRGAPERSYVASVRKRGKLKR